MTVTLAGGCRVSEMREGDAFIRGTLSIWNRIGRATGTQAISLRVMEFAPGKSPTIVNDDGDQILYVLHTDRDSIDIMIDGQCFAIDSDSGIYIRPSQTFGIHNRSDAL